MVSRRIKEVGGGIQYIYTLTVYWRKDSGGNILIQSADSNIFRDFFL